MNKNEWELELLEEMPNEFERTERGTYVQRKEVTEVEYHSLDGYQTFRGYECFKREIPETEYLLITNR